MSGAHQEWPCLQRELAQRLSTQGSLYLSAKWVSARERPSRKLRLPLRMQPQPSPLHGWIAPCLPREQPVGGFQSDQVLQLPREYAT